MDFKKGDLVMAVNGREKGEYFVIKDIINIAVKLHLVKDVEKTNIFSNS